MTNTTPIYWEAGTVSLSTYAWNVRTWGGTRNGLVPRRGNDVVIPFRRGQRHVRKMREAVSRTLEMWVLPLLPDGSVSSLGYEKQLQENLRTLAQAFDVEEQFSLTKRFWVNGVLTTAVGRAEYAGGFEPAITGMRAELAVELFMSDPYFYQGVAAQPVGAITVAGDSATDHVVLTLPAGVKVTFPDGNYIQYNGTGTATVDCYNGVANAGGSFSGGVFTGGSYVNGQIVRNPANAEWPSLPAGAVTLTKSGGSPTVAYDAAWR